MGINEMFIKNNIILSLSKRTSSATILFELLQAVLHKIIAKSAHLYFLKIKIFLIYISSSAVLNRKLNYLSAVLIAFLTSINFLILLMSSPFFLQNAPIFTYSNSMGWLLLQFLIVPSLLLSDIAISLYVIFSMRNNTNKIINILLNFLKVIYILLFKYYLKSFILYFFLNKSFIYDFKKRGEK